MHCSSGMSMLIEHRQKGNLTPEEYAGLLRLTDEVELFDAKRVELLIALARLRKQSFDDVMAELGISTQSHG
jgi:hypothetical protein